MEDAHVHEIDVSGPSRHLDDGDFDAVEHPRSEERIRRGARAIEEPREDSVLPQKAVNTTLFSAWRVVKSVRTRQGERRSAAWLYVVDQDEYLHARHFVFLRGRHIEVPIQAVERPCGLVRKGEQELRLRPRSFRPGSREKKVHRFQEGFGEKTLERRTCVDHLCETSRLLKKREGLDLGARKFSVRSQLQAIELRKNDALDGGHLGFRKRLRKRENASFAEGRFIG